jgi:D-xylose transport system substrate-binding protein
VLVISAVDVQSAPAIVQRAKQSDIPVISYERMIPADVDYYLSYDNCRVGELQAEALAERLKADGDPAGPIVKINGSPTDSNALEFKRCSTKVFRDAGVRVAREYDTPDWSPDKAQQEMEQAITALGQTGFAGVLAANDGTAGGAIAAMKGAGIKPSTRPTTGQDAELPAIQRILIGDQFMTVYKPIKPLADNAAEIAVKIAKGEDVPANLTPDKEDNGNKQVPTKTLDITVVTKDNVKDTVIKDGYWTASQVCTAAYASACKAAGVQ